MKPKVKIFLSYARPDEKRVKDIRKKLSNAGFEPWMDTRDLLPGERWQERIIRAIRDADLFIAVLSKNSFERRGMIQKEIKEALDVWKEKTDSDIYLIPLRIDDCEVPEILRHLHWVNYFRRNGFDLLLRSLREQAKKLGKTVKPAGSLQKPRNRVAPQSGATAPSAAPVPIPTKADKDQSKEIREQLSPVPKRRSLMPEVFTAIKPHSTWLDRDAALRWIRRYIAQRDFKRGKEFVASLRQNASDLFGSDVLFLDVYEDILSAWSGEDLENVDDRLEVNLKKLPENGDRLRARQTNLARAYGYNILGLVLRQLQRYHTATTAYHTALHYQQLMKLDWLESDTYNNLSYVYGLVGNFTLADQYCALGLKKREELKHKYAIALSYNTQGLIHLSRLRPDLALEPCKKALRLAVESEESRPQLFALVALGTVHRKLALSENMPLDKAEGHFTRAEELLRQALELLPKVEAQYGTRELDHEVEAYNELGCTFRDRASALRRRDNTQNVDTHLATAAKYLKESIKRATEAMYVERADGYDDLAEVYGLRGNPFEARRMLQVAEEIIPDEYKVAPGEAFQDIQDPINGCWLALGKLNLQRGNLQWENDHDEALRTYILADAYFSKYSRAGEIADRTVERIIPKIILLPMHEKNRLYQAAIKCAPSSTNLPLLEALAELAGGKE